MRFQRILGIYFLDALQFRLRGLIWLLTGSVNVLILLFFWWAVLRLSGGQGGLDLSRITAYFLVMMTVSSLTNCHNEEFIAFRQIYLGQIHQYLLQPYPYLARVFQQELVWRLVQGAFAVSILLAINFLITPVAIAFSPALIAFVLPSIVLALILSFLYKSILGLAAFWFVEVHGLLEIMFVADLLLGGYFLPLHLYPEMVRQALIYSPLGAMTYAPASILSGFAPPSEWPLLLAVQLGWVLLFAFAANLVFRRGVRRFGGVSQ